MAEHTENINVIIKQSNGNTHTFETNIKSNVVDFKISIASEIQIPAEQQRLVYRGQVMRDSDTLEKYGVANNHVIHIVKGNSTQSSQQSSSKTATTTTTTPPLSTPSVPPQIPPSTTTTPLFPPPSQTTQNIPPTNPFGFVPPTSGGPGMPNFSEFSRQMMQNPDIMSNMMNSPVMQSLMSNPELMRDMMINNPQMRQLLDQNPHLSHVLNDPTIFRQAMEMASNPAAMQEMMRQQDLAISQIENHPEGFNALRRMYEDIQEPMIEAQANVAQSFAQNPWGALQDQQNQQNRQQNAQTNQPSGPNTSALPNPWSRSTPQPRVFPTTPQQPFTPLPQQQQQQQQPQTSTTPSSTTQPTFPPFTPGFPMGFGGFPGAQNQLNMGQLMQDPSFQQALQMMQSNPALFQQMIASNPLTGQMFESHPELRQVFQNPEMLRRVFEPQNFQAMLQLEQAMRQLENSGLFPSTRGQMPFPNPIIPPTSSSSSSSSTTTTPTTPGLSVPALFNFPLATQTHFGETQPNLQGPSQQFTAQLSQMEEMGFTDRESNIRALIRTNGNVNAAIERLLNGLI